MKNVKVVIGNAFGDEGKGLITRHYCLTAEDPIVVLYNGSAQRGHTVELKDGTRHVFHHFGSGTLDNKPTYFAETFMVHPMTFEKEYMELAVRPTCFADPRCYVITPIDMVIDQIYEDYIEQSTGVREFGSCCYGTWSGTDRRNFINYSISDFYNGDVEQMLYFIYQRWFRLALVGRGVDMNKIPSQWGDYLDVANWSGIFAHFANSIKFMKAMCPLCSFDSIYNKYNDLIFEGGQGLLLQKGFKPNDGWNTTSMTGLTNPIHLLRPYSDYSGEACYVSRTYMTRHGDGPFKEIAKSELSADLTTDMTNCPNEFQGTLRYGTNDQFGLAEKALINDIALAPHFKVSTALTHCDEFECINPTCNLLSYSRYAEDIKTKW